MGHGGGRRQRDEPTEAYCRHQQRQAQARRTLLAPVGTEVDPTNAGDTCSEAGHGATTDQDRTEPEEEGDETLQRAIPTRGNNRVGDEARGTPQTVVRA